MPCRATQDRWVLVENWFLHHFKTHLNIWEFSVHILLKPSLKDFQNDLASMWNLCYLSAANWNLRRALTMTEQKRRLTSASMEIELHAAIAVNVPQCLREFRVEWGTPVQSLIHVQLFATPWTAAHQASLPIATPGVYSRSFPMSQWCHPTISSSVIPFSSHLQSFPALGSFKSVSSSHQVAKVLEFQLQHQSFQWIFRTDFL